MQVLIGCIIPDIIVHFRSQIIDIKLVMGSINNRFCIFLGMWPFVEEQFPLSYMTVVMIYNCLFDKRGYALQHREINLEKLVIGGNKTD